QGFACRGTHCGKRAYKHKAAKVGSILQRRRDDRFSALVIDGEIILGSASEGLPRDVIDRVYVFKRRLPVCRRIKSSVSEFNTRMIEILQVAGPAHQATHRLALLNEAVDKMTAYKTAAAADQHLR